VAVINVESSTPSNTFSLTKDLGYSYPNDLDLKPGSDIHSKIIQKVMSYARSSKDAMSSRHKVWNKIDEMLTAYIPLSDIEKAIKQKDTTKPVSIIVPYSYANMETILAYQSKAFLSSPVYQYEGVGPEDTIGAKLLELVVNQQARRYKHPLALHTGFRDGLAYGLHASYVRWDKKEGRKVQRKETPIYNTLGQQTGIKKEKENVDTILFEGNKIKNIDPYKYLPDVNVSAENIQEGEYVGWFEYENIYNLLSDEGIDGLFNVKYLKDNATYAGYKSIFATDESKRDKNQVRSNSDSFTTRKNQITLIYMYVTLVPSEWKLSDKKDPEKWFFLIGNDSIVLDARPLNLNHNMYPVAVNVPDFDGYSTSPISRLEMSYGLQEVLNWMFNSHVHNVRKSLNDMFIADPSLINMEDLANPEPGKLIRLRKSAWGRGVENAVKQFSVSDVTRGNIADATFIMDIMQRVNASSDAAMGMMRSGGERKSAAEFTGTFNSLISRLEHLASITSIQYLQDIAYLCASHTQQLMSVDTFARAVGDWPEVLTNEYGSDGGVSIDPFSIIADFDVVFKDGSFGNADAQTLTFWQQMFGSVSNDPELRQLFDVPRIFKHIARLAGAKDVGSFVKQTPIGGTVMPDEMVAQQLAAGNLMPAGGM